MLCVLKIVKKPLAELFPLAGVFLLAGVSRVIPQVGLQEVTKAVQIDVLRIKDTGLMTYLFIHFPNTLYPFWSPRVAGAYTDYC